MSYYNNRETDNYVASDKYDRSNDYSRHRNYKHRHNYKYENSDRYNKYENERKTYYKKPSEFTSVEQDDRNSNTPFRSVEGYIIFVSNIHQEATEDQIYEFFSNYGNIKNMHVNLDRQTGYLKGYVLLEFGELNEAEKVVKECNNKVFFGKNIKVSYAFKKR